MRSMDKTGGPAFPFEQYSPACTGMSLRDWFAGQALAGIMANSKLMIVLDEKKQDPASCAYQMADFMLNERNK